jgi:hypothetical protein
VLAGPTRAVWRPLPPPRGADGGNRPITDLQAGASGGPVCYGMMTP